MFVTLHISHFIPLSEFVKFCVGSFNHLLRLVKQSLSCSLNDLWNMRNENMGFVGKIHVKFPVVFKPGILKIIYQ